MDEPITSHNIKLQLAYYCRFKRLSIMMADEVTFGDFIADFAAIINWKLYEYEIKTSMSDLKNDFFKSRFGSGVENKHDLLQAGRGAHYFYFVVPMEMFEAALEIIPETLGIMTVGNTKQHDWTSIYTWQRCKPLRKTNVTNREIDAIFKRQQSLIYNYYGMLDRQEEFPK